MPDPDSTQKDVAADDAAHASGEPLSGMSLSMHAGVDASCDCCSCEAEPYWLEAMAEKPPPAGGR
jgi:hypothetical protein